MNIHSGYGKVYRTLAYCACCILLFIGNASSQTVVFFEDFGATPPNSCDQGTLANGFVTLNGAWTVTPISTNDSAANEWYISATEPGLPSGDCAVAGCFATPGFTNRTLHVGNVPNSPNAPTICATGDCGAVYDPGGFQLAVQTNKRAESPDIALSSTGVNQLVFNYIQVGEVGLDRVLIELFDGSVWLPTIAVPQSTTPCGGTVRWERYSLTLPSIAASVTNAKIGFRWENNNLGSGASPSFAVDSIIIINIDTLIANFSVSDSDICVNDCINFMADSAGPVASYSWTFTGAATSISNVQNPSSICYPNPGTYIATLLVSNPDGTSATQSKNIVVNPCVRPTADFVASDSNFCERSCITYTDLSINGATGWNWFFPGGIPATSSAPTPPPVCYDVPGVYDVTLIAFNQYGADTLVKTAYLTVDTCPFPIAGFTSVPVQFCPQHCVAFTDTSLFGPITSYQWFFPGGTPDTSSSPTPFVCYTEEGQYDVLLIVTNQYGTDTVEKFSEVNAQFVPNAFAGPDTAMYFGETYQLFASGGVSYLWTATPSDTSLDTTNIPDPFISPGQTTVYTVSITDSAGCVAKRQITVTIIHDNDFFVPNAFSPYNGGANNVLYVRGNNLYGVRLTIFDRWGEKIFETTDQTIGWDGTYNGKELDPGVFTYVVTVNYNDKQTVTSSGTVTLIR